MSLFTRPALSRVVDFSSFIRVGQYALPPGLRKNAVEPPRGIASGIIRLPSIPSVFAAVGSWMEQGAASLEKVRHGVGLLESSVYARLLHEQHQRNAPAGTLQRYVFDAQGHDALPPRAKLVRREGDGPSGNPEVDAAYDHGGFVFEFFRDRLGVYLKQPLLQVVNHSDTPWRVGTNSAHNMSLLLGARFILFGTSDAKHRSLAHCIDAIAHEAMHEVLQERFRDERGEEKFPYFGQTGSIVEHACDVVGLCVKAKYRDLKAPYPEDFWRMGAEFFADPKLCLKNFLAPGTAFDDFRLGCDVQVGHMRDYEVTEDDAGGVHVNSGILNRLFALFAIDAKLPIDGVPLDIWMTALENVRPEPTFRDFGMTLVEACELYDELHKTKLTAKMVRACREVGITDWIVHEGEVVKVAKVQR